MNTVRTFTFPVSDKNLFGVPNPAPPKVPTYFEQVLLVDVLHKKAKLCPILTSVVFLED